MQLTRHRNRVDEPGFSDLSEWARAATQQPDEFWERQHIEIRKRITSASRHWSLTLVTAWASAAAVVLLALLLLHSAQTPQASFPQNDSDQELLVGIEQSLQRGGPQALEPAAMLAEEISGNQNVSTSSRTYKENRNEAQ